MPFLAQGKTNWKYILIVVILATFVGGGVFYRWQALKEETKISESEISEKFTEVPEKETIEDETVDWKTYRNVRGRYEIKYPSDWEVTWSSDLAFVHVKKENCVLEIALIPKDVYKEDLDRLKDCEIKEMVINKIPSKKIICPTKRGFTRYYFQKDGKYFWVEPSDDMDLLKTGEPVPELFLPNCEEYFNQILSTFRLPLDF